MHGASGANIFKHKVASFLPLNDLLPPGFSELSDTRSMEEAVQESPTPGSRAAPNEWPPLSSGAYSGLFAHALTSPMPTAVVHKIDVTSPLIRYTGFWVRGGSKEDPAGEFADGDQPRYDEETFVFCYPGSQCSASLNFRGTEVHLVGAYRSNRGPVSFTLDGQDFGPYTVSTNPQQFQVEYFNGTGLVEDGIHTVTAVNAVSDNLTYDVDYITWTSTVNSTVDTRFQDDSAAFSYQPAHAWSVDLGNMTGFDDGTGHVGSMGSSATLKFSGDRVAVYGAIGAQGAPFTAQLDGGSSNKYTQQQSISDTPSENYLPSQLIYYADGLSDGNHTLVLSSASNSSVQVFTIDYALVDGTANQAPETTGTNTTTSVPGPISVCRSPANNKIALGVVSAIAGLLLVVAVVLVVYIVRLRRIVADLRSGYLGATPTLGEPEGFRSTFADVRGSAEAARKVRWRKFPNLELGVEWCGGVSGFVTHKRAWLESATSANYPKSWILVDLRDSESVGVESCGGVSGFVTHKWAWPESATSANYPIPVDLRDSESVGAQIPDEKD
uniref:Transmembrane protein n=1 Tax=Mycena chlorophos TaxID=658473 RepID=A0ABQ0LVR3_MYCCL|nr:predicted protein [Mycena chlorophos]